MKIPFPTFNRIGVSIVILSIVSILNAQNLVPNPSFEILTNCPTSYGGSGATIAPPWWSPSYSTPDIFNVCSTSGLVDVPDNFAGSQNPLTGDGYAGFFCYIYSYEYREYLMVELTQPLVGGTWYNVSFFVSPGENGCDVVEIGAIITREIPWLYHVGAYDLIPPIESNQGLLNDFNGWTSISGCFRAQGGERYLTIGNFRSDANTTIGPGCGGMWSYYYLEDVSVVAVIANDEIPLELGDPVTACPPYVIDPDLSGYHFTWEDGSHNPTLEVTESGTYALTITDDDCNYGIDSVEITILSILDPIDIGPPQLSICEGEEYSISLDPTLSEYTWQDGSNDPDYTISTSGTYSVTLDDGCSSSTDQIVVELISPPEFIFLGDDMFLCQGDQVTFSFDPAIGDFLWQDNSTSYFYTATTGGTYAVTVSNICGEDSDEIVITELETPIINIGADDQTLCEGESIIIALDPDIGDILWQDGSTSSEYEITTPGIYSVAVTNQCGSDNDQVTVTLLNPPVTDLGDDLFLCSGETILLSDADDQGTYLWQDNSTSEEFLVSGPGTYSLTITNECGTSSDNIVVDYLADVIPPDLGPDVSLCPGEQVVLHANSLNAGYLWQDFSTEEFFIVTAAGTYFVDVFNDCGLESDTIVVTVNNTPPQVDLPSQLNLCQSQSITLDAMASGVNFLWNDNSQNQQLLVNTPGTYSVTVSNACGTDADTTIIVDGGPAPMVDLGTDIQLCIGDTVVVSPVFSNVTSWLWQDGSALSSYSITNSGIVNIAVSNLCGTAYDTLQSSLLPATPPLDLGVDTSLCSGESFTLTISAPGVDILWSDGSNGPDFNVSASGLIHATISNSCGQSVDTIIVDDLPGIPNLNLGSDQSLCPGEIITINPGIPNVVYQWSDGSTLDSFQTMQEQTIILIISNLCGTSTDTLEVYESTQGPQVDLGQDILACEGEVVLIPSGISGVNYLWQDGSTDPDFTTTLSGQFILQVNNNCGTDTDTIMVDIAGVPPTPSLGPDTTLCSGNSFILSSAADAGTSIEWQDGSSSPSFTVVSPGLYTLSESNHCGAESDTILVSFVNAPAPFSLGPDTILCAGETMTLDAPATTFEIQWQDGTSTASYLISASGLYILSVTNQCGEVTDDILVSYLNAPGTFSLGPDTTLCADENYTLFAPANASNIEWQDGSSAPSYDVIGPGIYSVTASNQCGETGDTVLVVYVEAPLPFSLGPDTLLCPGESLILIAPSTVDEILWQDGSAQQVMIAEVADTYSLQLSNVCGSVTDELILSFETHYPQLNIDPLRSWCEGDVITLDATQPFFAAYLWSTGDSTPSIELSTPGIYSIEVSTLCKVVSQEIEIITGADCETIDANNEIYIPNIFSPNDDGINDVFALSFGSDLQVTAMSGSIFDRWGNLIFSSAEIPFQWDGLFAEEQLMPGVYVYVIRCAYLLGSEEKEKVFSGDVTLVR